MKDRLQDAVDDALSNPGQFMARDKMAGFIQQTKSWEHEAENFHAMAEAAKPAEKKKRRHGLHFHR